MAVDLKLEIIQSPGLIQLEQDVNKWLSEQVGYEVIKMDIEHVTSSVVISNRFTATIWYRRVNFSN